MLRFSTTLFVGSCLLIGGATTVSGQEQSDSKQYEAQALRLETRPGAWILVRGWEGVEVGRLGVLRGGVDLQAVMAPSANAVREARAFERDYSRGGLTAGIGIAAFGVGYGIARIDDVDSNVTTPATIVSVAGAILAVYGGFRLQKAYNALNRSIWWYNRDLPR